MVSVGGDTGEANVVALSVRPTFAQLHLPHDASGAYLETTSHPYLMHMRSVGQETL